MDYFKRAKIGFIGAGNMAQALGNGMIQSGLVEPDQLCASDPNGNMVETWKRWGCKTTSVNGDILKESDIVIFAVKPHLFASVVQSLHIPSPRDVRDILFISIMSGIRLDTIEKALAAQFAKLVPPVVRVMPNTPALVGAGAAVYSMGLMAREVDGPKVEAIFKSVGICQKVFESQIDAFTGLHGSGPAYIYMAIEALSDGAVKMGIPRSIATQFAAQTVMGSAKMVLETGRHPGSLKDDVCSPAGTTIEAVHSLEKAGFRAALIGAVEAAAKKAQQQGLL